MASDAVAIALGVVIPVVVIAIIVIVIIYMIRKKRFKIFHRKKNFKEVSFKDNPALTGKFPETPRNSAMDDMETGKENEGYVTTAISQNENETSFTLNDMILDRKKHENFSNCENEISGPSNNSKTVSDTQSENHEQSVYADEIESKTFNKDNELKIQPESTTLSFTETERSRETERENANMSEMSNNGLSEHSVNSEMNLDSTAHTHEDRQSIKNIEDIRL